MKDILGVCIILLAFFSVIFSFFYKKRQSFVYKRMAILCGLVTVGVMAIFLLTAHVDPTIAKSIPKDSKKNAASTQPDPILATNAGMPGVTDAATDALTKKQIQHQNKDAENSMNEKAMTPKILSDGTKEFILTATPIVWNLYQQKNVNVWGYNGQTSGPLLRVKVGDRVKIILKNKLKEPTSLRFNGISIPAKMGGIPNKPISPGSSFTYEFKITSDMVGTHSYGSGTNMDKQINYGLHGVLLVEPEKSMEYPDADVDAIFDIGSFIVDQKTEENVFTLNGKPGPNSPNLQMEQGQRVIIRIINSSAESYHAMHLHGYTFQLVSQDGHHLAKPVSMNVVNLAPEETADIEFVANAPGMWMFHCHILDHTMNPDDEMDEMSGLMTNFMVKPKGKLKSDMSGM
ncbi:multicopper oxidase family protein [Neobacillus cucumis]|uniref:multicopper oxidase family protein n=1 Tax=Neobacillus cucumis TaxID=1740721 RepID=UPI001EF87E82|nr:multicopper oxidase domain-containing protein [Neobacillus cucumis]